MCLSVCERKVEWKGENGERECESFEVCGSVVYLLCHEDVVKVLESGK